MCLLVSRVHLTGSSDVYARRESACLDGRTYPCVNGVQDQDVRERSNSTIIYSCSHQVRAAETKKPTLPSYIRPVHPISYQSHTPLLTTHSFNPVPPARLLPPSPIPPARLCRPGPRRPRPNPRPVPRPRTPVTAPLLPCQIPRHLNRLPHNPHPAAPGHLPRSRDQPLHVPGELYPEAREQGGEGAACDEGHDDEGEDL